MNESAYELLFDRLSGDGGPEEALGDLILAAADGDEALEALVGGQPAPARRTPSPAAAAAEPARVYLERITVENFRGIGEAASLPLEPGPGLTLVVGRNGSGKSSFAEGLELLLTGTNLRWEDRTKVWKEGWRNLHGSGPATLSARFRVDGESVPLDVRRRWPPGSTLDSGDPVTVSGPRGSWSELAWEAPLQRFRPLLSYNELGTMFSTRAAALYEALSAVLGVQEFDAITARLRAARLALNKSEKQEKTERVALMARLGDVDEPRAATVIELIAKRTPDLEAVERLVIDDGGPDPDEAPLQGLATLDVPAGDDVAKRLEALNEAIAELDRRQATDAERLDALSRLLTDAMAFHERHGEGQTCPVCGTPDVLDPGWSLRSQAEVQELGRRSQDLRTARSELAERRADVDRLFAASIPGALRAVTSADVGIDTAEAAEAWDDWAALLRREPGDIARGGTELGQRLSSSLAPLRAAASEAIEARRDAWRPVRQDVLAWLGTARRAARDKESVTRLKAAEDWMASLAADLRRERLRPVVDAAQANWAQLRHESNVALGNVELRKEGMQRYAAFDVTVDGTASSAFGVMSQGELSALAVSIFLPRASLAESPFGFMVIDDPVQSMDPAKVDGLARVLSRAAKDRQVVVFTHDERLPEAVRRLRIDARIVSVKRRAASKVELVAGRPPSDRYVGEAFALAQTDDLPAEVRARVIPGFCRSAVEAACEARVRRRLIEAGVPHAQVEEALGEPRKLTAWLAEAFELSVAQGNDVTERVRRIGGDDAVRAVAIMRKGAHELVQTDELELVAATRRLVRALEPA
jgi:ABC-type molybdenum transport system ATPase subunit/photorepair protein PhrA